MTAGEADELGGARAATGGGADRDRPAGWIPGDRNGGFIAEQHHGRVGDRGDRGGAAGELGAAGMEQVLDELCARAVVAPATESKTTAIETCHLSRVVMSVPSFQMSRCTTAS